MAEQSNIEQFVRFYLSKFRNSTEHRGEKIYIEKAIAQIDFFLDEPCCLDPEASITFARRDNSLTRYLTSIFNNKFDKRKHRKSLLRAKKLLQNFLGLLCCEVVSSSLPPTEPDKFIS